MAATGGPRFLAGVALIRRAATGCNLAELLGAWRNEIRAWHGNGSGYWSRDFFSCVGGNHGAHARGLLGSQSACDGKYK